MKTELLYDRLSDKWVPAPIDSLLTDKPFSNILNSSLFSGLDSPMLETANGYKLEVAVPGMKKRDLTLEVSDGVLTVQGQKREQDLFGWFGKPVEYTRMQIYKTFILPKDADTDRIKAKCKDGLLRISIPKAKSKLTFKSIPLNSVENTEGW